MSAPVKGCPTLPLRGGGDATGLDKHRTTLHGLGFLTPIGHQCNTLVMGPGGCRFADHSWLGLPLSLILIAVGTALTPCPAAALRERWASP